MVLFKGIWGLSGALIKRLIGLPVRQFGYAAFTLEYFLSCLCGSELCGSEIDNS